ncbi:MAG: hypothetical protein ACPL0B_00885 [Anaerolineales bacterium]
MAKFQLNPGYMDAEYYYATAQNLFAGRGFTEPFIWNFLNQPVQIPTPSHLYWMPLPTLLAYLGMLIGHQSSWFWGRLPFLLLATFIPPLTFSLSWWITKDVFVARFSGLMALFAGFYTPYTATTDTFVISMLLGTGWIIIADKALRQKGYWIILAGFLSGLLHLTRADGIVWLCLLIGFGLWQCYRDHLSVDQYFLWGTWAIIGYLSVMGGWYWRNWHLFRRIFPPGNIHTLWLRNYDDLFSYPADRLNFLYWWQNGITQNLRDRFYALGQNSLSFLAVNAEIFWIGLLIWGAWRWRSKPISKIIWLSWLAFLFLMSFVFPYAGYRGSFFHASAAFQPFFWVMGGLGFVKFINWGSHSRGWDKNQALRFFLIASSCFAFLFTVIVTYQRVIGADWKRPVWNEGEQTYLQLCPVIQRDSKDFITVMVNNPVGFYLACHINAIAIPVGGIDEVLLAVRTYHVNWLILEQNHPPEMDQFYDSPHDFANFKLVQNGKDWQIYSITPP